MFKVVDRWSKRLADWNEADLKAEYESWIEMTVSQWESDPDFPAFQVRKVVDRDTKNLREARADLADMVRNARLWELCASDDLLDWADRRGVGPEPFKVWRLSWDREIAADRERATEGPGVESLSASDIAELEAQMIEDSGDDCESEWFRWLPVRDAAHGVPGMTVKMVDRLCSALADGMGPRDAVTYAVGKHWGRRGEALLEAVAAVESARV